MQDRVDSNQMKAMEATAKSLTDCNKEVRGPLTVPAVPQRESNERLDFHFLIYLCKISQRGKIHF